MDRPAAAHGTTRFLQLSGLLLAIVLFVIDTFTTVESAIAVLYVLVMLLLVSGLQRRGIFIVTVICAWLTISSFLFTHGKEADLPSIMRLGVSLAAIIMTGALLSRDQATRNRLIRANSSLFRSEWRFRSIFELSPFSLWEQDYSELIRLLDAFREQGVTDLASHAKSFPQFYCDLAASIITTNVNKATLELLGADSKSQVLGPLTPFLPSDGTGFFKVIQSLFEGNSRFEGPGTILGMDGKVRTILIGIAFPNDASEFRRVVVNIVDITQREQMQEVLLAARAELARASRAATVGALSASIAHELNQPLAALVINAQTCLRWLSRTPPDIRAASVAAERTVRDGRRASAIVQKTRDMIVKGNGDNEILDLRQVTIEVAELLERELSANSVRLLFDGESRQWKVSANRVDMQQVLVNLITNAIQAMTANSAARRDIIVHFDQPDSASVRLSVRDHGPGIGEADMINLFEPFYTTKGGGMGMGLAISRSAVEANGGALTAHNHEDGGAVFEMVLPSLNDEDKF